MKNNDGIHIRVADIIYGVIKHRFLIIVLTAAGLLTGVVLSGISYLRGEMSREYLITSSFSVNTNSWRSGLADNPAVPSRRTPLRTLLLRYIHAYSAHAKLS